VADDGNYSIQVLQEALKGFGNLICAPIEKKDVKNSIKDYSAEEAYICHSVDHWIAIRKLFGTWYNLNSTNIVPPGPQIISDFYLAAFLDSIKNSGYTIFVVRLNPATGSEPLPLPKKHY
jgi:ataxin-3